MHAYIRIQFFPYFPDQRLLRGLARLQFSARKLPAATLFTVAALGGENVCGRKGIITQNGRSHTDLLHIPSISDE